MDSFPYKEFYLPSEPKECTVIENGITCGRTPALWMVKKQFFCKHHAENAKVAAYRETRGLDKSHFNDSADRKEQAKRGGM